MGFFDLNIPFPESSPSGKATIESTRTKLVVKAMELGYTGIAYNRTIKGVMSDQHRCSISLPTLSSLLKLAPSISSSVKLHRDLLGIPVATPFRQYRRLTVCVDSPAQAQALNSGNPILKTYDLVAVKPLNQAAFDQACQRLEVDVIAIDFSVKLPFRLKQPMVKAAAERGVYFEITYSDLITNIQTRRQLIFNAKLLVDWTRGRNIILSSAAPSVNEVRGPYDVMNLSSLLGLSMERAKAAVSKNCRTLLTNALRKKQFYKGTIRVEEISSVCDSKEAWHELLKWDPLSNGEGDLLLDDMAKSFSASSKMSKTVKAIDFASVIDSMPSHGFQVKDLISVNKAGSLSPDVHKHSFSFPEVIEPTATCPESDERPKGLDDLPGLDKASLSDTPTIYQISNIGTFQETSTPSRTTKDVTVAEEIEMSANCNLTEVKTHDSHSDERISELNVVLPDQNKKLSVSLIDAELDDVRDMDGKVEIVSPSAEFCISTILDDQNTKSCDVNLSTQEATIFQEKKLLASNDVFMSEKLLDGENFDADGNDVVLVDQIPHHKPSDEMITEDDSSGANNKSSDVTSEELNNGEANTKTDQLTLVQSMAGKSRGKRRRHHLALLYPFKRMLSPTPSKRKARKTKKTMRI
ncbi:Ribonuclease P subunit p30 [Quillaja saponaria]|uniref:Ribonuclease P subunit p30 n=1 Tax=Quillaja saponaria TaxID=32244 RepID=A0AAD7QG66_QUISA|nr:Ribonuclease P subunit p30 [Quillaja saponaria]